MVVGVAVACAGACACVGGGNRGGFCRFCCMRECIVFGIIVYVWYYTIYDVIRALYINT